MNEQIKKLCRKIDEITGAYNRAWGEITPAGGAVIHTGAKRITREQLNAIDEAQHISGAAVVAGYITLIF